MELRVGNFPRLCQKLHHYGTLTGSISLRASTCYMTLQSSTPSFDRSSSTSIGRDGQALMLHPHAALALLVWLFSSTLKIEAKFAFEASAKFQRNCMTLQPGRQTLSLCEGPGFTPVQNGKQILLDDAIFRVLWMQLNAPAELNVILAPGLMQLEWPYRLACARTEQTVSSTHVPASQHPSIPASQHPHIPLHAVPGLQITCTSPGMLTTALCKISRYLGGHYEERRLLGYKNSSSYFTGDTLRLRYRVQPVNAM
jgi:hypothetical protein